MQNPEELIKEINLYKQRERELLLRIDELTDFLENASLPIHWVDKEGTIIWANKAELDLLGYPKDEYIGQPISKFHVDEKVLDDILSRLTGDETLDNYPARLKCKDGGVKHVLINSNVYRKDGEFIHTRCFTRDVSNVVAGERQKAGLLAALEQSETRLRMAMDSTMLGTWDYNPVNGELIWSDECRRIYGASPDEEVDFSLFAEHIHPDDREFVEREIRKSMDPAKGGSYDISYRILRFGNLEPRWIHAQGKVYFNETGEATRFIGTVLDITAARQAEEQIKKSTKLFKTIALNIPNTLILIIDKEQRFIAIEGDIMAKLGYDTTLNYEGRHPADVLPPARYKVAKPLFERVLAGEKFSVETKSFQGDDFIVHLVPLRTDTNEVYGGLIMAMDITEIKQAEEKAAKLAAIVQSSDDAIISKNFDGIITSWNYSAQRMFGYTADEIIGKSILTLIPEDRQGEEPMIISRLKNGERVEHFETKRITKDRRLIDLSLTISPIRDSHGNIIGISKIARDITDLKQAEEQAAKLAAIVQSSDDAIISKNFDGIITSWNNSAQRMFGYTADEIIGKSILTLIPEDRQQEEPMIISRLRKGERVEHFETKRVTKDKRIIDLSLTISPVKDSNGNIIGISKIARDITAKKQEEIRKNDFIAIVSHELKTPLTSVKSYIQVLLAKAMKEGNDFTIKALSRAEVQTNKMTYMINDFLSLARLEEGKIHLNKELFEVHPLMEDLAHDAQFLASGHEIKLLDCEKLAVYADKDKISQVMINLLSNAMKYSPKGSTVIMGCEKHNGTVKIFVSDNGVGISRQDQKRLFERFYRVESEKMKTVSGFGIGLYLVAEILKFHGSKIEVESEVGKGSTFWFELKAEKV